MPAAAPDLAALRARIRAMERLRPPPGTAVPVAEQVDRALPGGGLALGQLHQLLAEDAAATAFAATLAGRLAERLDRPVAWILAGDDLYGPGLAPYGLGPARLVVVRSRNDEAALWAMEEALRCPELACVVAELRRLELTAGRRLQLAAEDGGVTGLALHPPLARAANAGSTRWRVAAAPGGCWRLVLERCRGGMPGEWVVGQARDSW
ncbi:MAG: ImuA family protein [Actinomycetota bacterium]